MAFPTSLKAAFDRLPPDAQILVKRDYVRREKTMTSAYLAWLFLGWHYLYLKRVGLQFAFWITLGGFFIWWFFDLFRVAGLVKRMNEDTARELMVQYKMISS